MRKWLWSLVMAVLGVVVGMWWIKEREATTPALIEEDELTVQKPPVAKQKPPKTSKPDEEDEIEVTSRTADVMATPDALSELNGIGPAFERALNTAGVFSYAQLAEQDPTDLAKRMNARGVTAERIVRDEWIEQAKARLA